MTSEIHMNAPIPLGLYRHYKGRDYSVLGFARHSETQEVMVLYVPLYGEGGYWVRPLDMFSEDVEVDGKIMPRFRYSPQPRAKDGLPINLSS